MRSTSESTVERGLRHAIILGWITCLLVCSPTYGSSALFAQRAASFTPPDLTSIHAYKYKVLSERTRYWYGFSWKECQERIRTNGSAWCGVTEMEVKQMYGIRYLLPRFASPLFSIQIAMGHLNRMIEIKQFENEVLEWKKHEEYSRRRARRLKERLQSLNWGVLASKYTQHGRVWISNWIVPANASGYRHDVVCACAGKELAAGVKHFVLLKRWCKAQPCCFSWQRSGRNHSLARVSALDCPRD